MQKTKSILIILLFLTFLFIFKASAINNIDIENIVNDLTTIRDLLNTSSNKGRVIAQKVNLIISKLEDLPEGEACNELLNSIPVDLTQIKSLINKKTCRGKKTTKCILPSISGEVIPTLEEIINQINENNGELIEICEGTSSSPTPTPESTPSESPNSSSSPNSSPNPTPTPTLTQETYFTSSCNPSTTLSHPPSLNNFELSVETENLYGGKLKIFILEENGGDTFALKNESLVPYELMISLNTSTNINSFIPSPIQLLAGSTVTGFKFCQNNSSSAWNYTYNYEYALGVPISMHNWDGFYVLPYKSGESYLVIQGENGTFSHFGDLINSIDFEMPEGTEIVAMRDGTVLFVKEDSNEHGADVSFKNKANNIWILHDDGTIAAYLHLRLNGVIVNVGDKVKAKDVIGYSGNTGYSTGPHLHIQLSLPRGFTQTEYIPIRFKGIDGPLIEGNFYTAE